MVSNQNFEVSKEKHLDLAFWFVYFSADRKKFMTNSQIFIFLVSKVRVSKIVPIASIPDEPNEGYRKGQIYQQIYTKLPST